MAKQAKLKEYKKVSNASIHQPKIEVPKELFFVTDQATAEWDHYKPPTEHRKYSLYVYVWTKRDGPFADREFVKKGLLLPLKEEELMEIIQKEIAIPKYI